MVTIAENLQTLQDTKIAIKSAIENKGQDLAGVPFTEYAGKIEAIEGGGVDKSAVVKQLVDARKSAGNLFRGELVGWTNETLREWLKYDTTENATDFDYAFAMWGRWNEITEIPLVNTSKGTSFYFCIDYAHRVKIVPAFDLRSYQNLNSYYFIRYAYDLEEIWVRNIKTRLCIGFKNEWGTKVKKECLIHLIKECRDTGSANNLYVSYASDEILDTVYVRTIDITDEMRAEDDLIDEKLPFEVCESTDEGAMPIKEYALLKNWQIVTEL